MSISSVVFEPSSRIPHLAHVPLNTHASRTVSKIAHTDSVGVTGGYSQYPRQLRLRGAGVEKLCGRYGVVWCRVQTAQSRW